MAVYITSLLVYVYCTARQWTELGMRRSCFNVNFNVNFNIVFKTIASVGE